MQNVLKRKNMYFCQKILSKTFYRHFNAILDLLMCISENLEKKYFGGIRKKRVLPYGGGGSEIYGHVPNLKLFDAFPLYKYALYYFSYNYFITEDEH